MAFLLPADLLGANGLHGDERDEDGEEQLQRELDHDQHHGTGGVVCLESLRKNCSRVGSSTCSYMDNVNLLPARPYGMDIKTLWW